MTTWVYEVPDRLYLSKILHIQELKTVYYLILVIATGLADDAFHYEINAMPHS